MLQPKQPTHLWHPRLPAPDPASQRCIPPGLGCMPSTWGCAAPCPAAQQTAGSGGRFCLASTARKARAPQAEPSRRHAAMAQHGSVRHGAAEHHAAGAVLVARAWLARQVTVPENRENASGATHRFDLNGSKVLHDCVAVAVGAGAAGKGAFQRRLRTQDVLGARPARAPANDSGTARGLQCRAGMWWAAARLRHGRQHHGPNRVLGWLGAPPHTR